MHLAQKRRKSNDFVARSALHLVRFTIRSIQSSMCTPARSAAPLSREISRATHEISRPQNRGYAPPSSRTLGTKRRESNVRTGPRTGGSSCDAGMARKLGTITSIVVVWNLNPIGHVLVPITPAPGLVHLGFRARSHILIFLKLKVVGSGA